MKLVSLPKASRHTESVRELGDEDLCINGWRLCHGLIKFSVFSIKRYDEGCSGKDVEGKMSWPVLRHYPGIFMDGLCGGGINASERLRSM